MSLLFKLILFVLLFLPKGLGDDLKNADPNGIKSDKIKVHFLKPNTTFNFKPVKRGFLENFFTIYCYSGEPKTLRSILETIEPQLEIETNDFMQYEGNSPAEIEEHYAQHRSIFNLNLFSQKRLRLSLSPFAQQCIGIETVLPYNVTFNRQNVDFYRSLQLISGVIIFELAAALSENSLLYYITGILLGICSSFLLLVWLTGKLMPKRAMMYGIVIGGWTVGFYVIRMLWNNVQLIILTYRNIVCWYVIITGIISFLFCYRWGPPRNRRSKNIIKWLLQLTSSAMIYFSTYFKEAACFIILLLVIFQYIPGVLHKTGKLRTKTSRELLNKKQHSNTTCNLKDGCIQCQLKHGVPIINSDLETRLTPAKKQTPAKLHLKNINAEQQHTDEYSSGSDVNLSEQDLTKQKLYPLSDGSFLLSEKPPIIITPVYHRSTPAFTLDEQYIEDTTPKNHSSAIPLSAYSYRLSASSSTSDLVFPRLRCGTPSPTQLHRSNSVQCVQPCSTNNNPGIEIENSTSNHEN